MLYGGSRFVLYMYGGSRLVLYGGKRLVLYGGSRLVLYGPQACVVWGQQVCGDRGSANNRLSYMYVPPRHSCMIF